MSEARTSTPFTPLGPVAPPRAAATGARSPRSQPSLGAAPSPRGVLSPAQARRVAFCARRIEPAGGAGYEALKRGLDVVAAGSALVVLSPLFLLMAVLIKLEDGGPILYTQTRLGRHGRPFPFLKLRSMRVSADAERQQLVDGSVRRFKLLRDPRVTRVGVWLRRFSLDELPQLVNVLRGDMTLVGPRPPLPEEVELYTPHECQRLAVAQGLTCFWQVAGRSDIPFDQQVELDLKYIRERSLWLDLALLLRTVPAVLSGRGAY